MKKLILIAALPIFTLTLSCRDSEEKVTDEEVLEQFDQNSPRPPVESEFQEDSAMIEGTPIETE